MVIYEARSNDESKIGNRHNKSACGAGVLAPQPAKRRDARAALPGGSGAVRAKGLAGNDGRGHHRGGRRGQRDILQLFSEQGTHPDRFCGDADREAGSGGGGSAADGASHAGISARDERAYDGGTGAESIGGARAVAGLSIENAGARIDPSKTATRA